VEVPGASRRFVFPEPGDTLARIAAHQLPGLDPAAATEQLLSWNLHLAMRPLPIGEPGAVLGSDIVYVEPPTPS